MVTRAKDGIRQPNPRYHNLSVTVVSPVPRSVRSALSDPHWLAAMRSEYDALVANRTWTTVPRPPGANIITGKWYFGISSFQMALWTGTRPVGLFVALHNVSALISRRPSLRLSNPPRFVLFFSLLHLVIGLLISLTSITPFFMVISRSVFYVSSPLVLLIPLGLMMSACSHGLSMV